MAGLTQLVLSTGQRGLANGLRLPGVKLLKVFVAHLGFLATLQAPQVQALQSYSDTHVQPGFRLQLPGGDVDDEQQEAELAMLQRCAQGVLKHCNHLRVLGNSCPSRFQTLMEAVQEDTSYKTTAEVTTAALQALGKWWCPDPSLVDGSLLHVQSSAASTGGVREAREAERAGGWRLELYGLPLTQSALAALPQGLTYLDLS
jgi:hypothetical protein